MHRVLGALRVGTCSASEGTTARIYFRCPTFCSNKFQRTLATSTYLHTTVDHSLFPHDPRYLAEYCGIQQDALRLQQVATMLLRICAMEGLTLYDIGTILYKPPETGLAYDDDPPADEEDGPSVLHVLVR